MQLQTNQSNEVASLKKEMKFTNILLMIALIAIPVMIAVLLNVQGGLQSLKMYTKDILKGVLIGFTALPVMIYVGIKTNGQWYAKKWAWAIFIVLFIAVLATVFFLANASSTGGMPPMGGMPGAQAGGMMQ